MMTLILSLASQWRLIGAAALAAALAGALGLWRLEAAHAGKLQAALAAAQSAQAAAQAQAGAAGAAAAVTAAGAARDLHTADQHTENTHVIQSAAGSAQGLDPALNDAGRRGLCNYAAYRGDPACVQLRGDGAGQRPAPIPGTPLPAADATAGALWIALDDQTARLDQANGRLSDVLAIMDKCEAERAKAAAPQKRRGLFGWLGF